MRFVSFFGRAGRAAVMACLAALALGAFATSAAAAGEGFGIKKLESGTCTENGQAAPAEECTYATPSRFYTQAAGHPNYGITFFEFDTTEAPGPGGSKANAPKGNVKNIRTDLPLGLSVNGQALPRCSMAEFGPPLKEGVYTPPTCNADTIVGENIVTVTLEVAPGVYVNDKLTGTAYNLEPPAGVPLEIGVAIDISSLAGKPAGSVYAHTLLEGGVSWYKGEKYASGVEVPESGNFHEYFKINEVSKELPLVASRLIFNGQAGEGFLQLPSACGAATTRLWVESYTRETATETTTPPANTTPPGVVSNCGNVPFKPEVNVSPSTTTAGASDGATVEVLVPQSNSATAVNSSTLKDAEVTLPEGMTLNPAAAAKLATCSPQQFHRGEAAAVECPATSQIGTDTIETPTLPKGSLTGDVYVAAPEAGAKPASGNEYRIYINAESKRYGVAIRLEGKVKADESTGKLTTLVAENPPLPFSDFALRLQAGENGARDPLANAVTCGAQATVAAFTPNSAEATKVTGLLGSPFTTTGCAAFAPTQTTASSSSQAGASTSFDFELTRPDNEPYVSTLSTTLPPGLVGKIPSVTQCAEAQASTATCPAASAIGTALVRLGAGASPLELPSSVYLTGPYDGAPYGLSIVTNAEKVGPYDYGIINTRAKIDVNPSTAQVTIASQLPTVVGGAPIRLQSLLVKVERPNFMINPTSCATLATTSSIVSTTGAIAAASSPFRVTGCGSLKFTPSFKAGSNGKPSRKEGASLKTTLTLPAGGANVKSVAVTLPKKLPSRESTLEHACLLATFEANPASCAASKVGTASATTPVLPGTLTGNAYYVSLGHAGFPNLDVVLEGDGVRIVLVGQTNIKGKITHTKFLTLPDVPVSTFTLNLPMGADSALSANGSLCKSPLYLPTTIEGQNGAKLTQRTRINVSGCGVVVKRHIVKGRKLEILVKTPSAGKILVSGAGLVRKSKRVGKATVATISEKLSRAGARKLAKKHRLNVAVRVKFKPRKGKPSKVFFRVQFKR
ncbi:MAG: hypothetical protein ACYCX7_07885 [Solirubrobacteraceae bacterium]